MSETWSAEDQATIDTFAREVLKPVLETNDPHKLYVVVHGFAQALGAAMAHDLAQRPELAAYYVQVCDRLREHVLRSVPAPAPLTEH